MLWKRCLKLGLAMVMGGAIAHAQPPETPIMPGAPEAAPAAGAAVDAPAGEGAAAAETESSGGYGPTPLLDVKILQNLLTGDAEKPWFRIAGWVDFDYTYRSSGHGINNVAPVENRFGNEILNRETGLYLWKPLDSKELSWGFNCIFIGGSDASFLGPTAGGWANTNPRWGGQFTDLNLTCHLPIFTEGGVDVKAGRQTTCLGPMGALPWQRYFDSSDYAWYNLEEGRYTGISAIWHVSKRLDWYLGIEIGGWGVFYDKTTRNVNGLSQVNFWLDEDAKKAKVWATVLTGPTGFQVPGKDSTVVELGLLVNWTDRIYQILDTQNCRSKAPVFGFVPPGYQERAYDVYQYLGYHLTKTVDINTRVEWYKDVDGGGYPGGFGVPHTSYYEVTVGPDFHPTKWVQIRPEVRYDYATHPNFGLNGDKKDQVSVAVECLFKF